MRRLRRKDGDRRANLPAVGGETDVFYEGLEDIHGGREVAHIAYNQ